MKNTLLAVVCFGLLCSSVAKAVTVCETDRSGRMCCWDADKYGPFKPITCN
jgi:hypothetical protein